VATEKNTTTSNATIKQKKKKIDLILGADNRQGIQSKTNE
jgi:hypothetical protein